MNQRIALGRRGEDLALTYLEQADYEILDRNWRCRAGEIDIVARDARYLVCVEVRTRSGSGFGHPLETLTPEKLLRMRDLALAWRAEHPEFSGMLRLDAIGVLLPPGAEPQLRHIVGVGTNN
ncbi:YraN family protein [Gulosibacter sp. GYB002]|uniref:YraN family protein n=1 Tax=Gulosibacter sp. GYB002 TaxID=2994391 RepID=UPI002F969EA0